VGSAPRFSIDEMMTIMLSSSIPSLLKAKQAYSRLVNLVTYFNRSLNTLLSINQTFTATNN
jgi:hypothetical protein